MKNWKLLFIVFVVASMLILAFAACPAEEDEGGKDLPPQKDVTYTGAYTGDVPTYETDIGLRAIIINKLPDLFEGEKIVLGGNGPAFGKWCGWTEESAYFVSEPIVGRGVVIVVNDLVAKGDAISFTGGLPEGNPNSAFGLEGPDQNDTQKDLQKPFKSATGGNITLANPADGLVYDIVYDGTAWSLVYYSGSLPEGSFEDYTGDVPEAKKSIGIRYVIARNLDTTDFPDSTVVVIGGAPAAFGGWDWDWTVSDNINTTTLDYDCTFDVQGLVDEAKIEFLAGIAKGESNSPFDGNDAKYKIGGENVVIDPNPKDGKVYDIVGIFDNSSWVWDLVDVPYILKK